MKPNAHEDGNKSEAHLEESQGLLSQLERQPGGTLKATRDTETDTKKHIDSEERFTEQIHTGHVGSVLFICTMFVVAVSAILFMSPMLLLINNKEQLSNDLNDSLYAYYTYSNRILGGQLGAGCDDETIECKFKTMSPMLKERFERYGFMLPGASESANDRYKVPVLAHPAKGFTASNASSLSSARKSDADMNTLLDKVYSSRTGMYQDRQFFERLLAQFGIEQDNTLGGTTAKDFKESFDNRVKNGDPRYVDANEDPAGAAESSRKPQDSIDENGRGIYSLGSLSTMSNKWTSSIYPNLIGKANTHMALACAFATYGNLAENSVRRAKMVSIARFAMNYLAVADDIKSIADRSDNHIAVDVLANNLIQPLEQGGKNGMDASTYKVPALGESSSSDLFSVQQQLSPLIQLGILRAPMLPSVPGSLYLKGAMNTVRTSASSRTPSGLCAEGMSGAQMGQERGGLCWSPASMPLASYIGAVAGGIIGAAKDPIEQVLCPFAYPSVVAMVKAATTPEASTALPMAYLQAATKSDANNFTSDVRGVKAQNIIFAGAGAILGDRAQTLGMRPTNTLKFTEYYTAAKMAREEIEQQEQELARATPWDATNPHTFLGSVVAKLAPVGHALPVSSWQQSTASLLSSVPISFASLLQTSASAFYTQPVHFQAARLLPTNTVTCGLPAELTAYITPDFACNTRYSMSTEELNLSISDILDYMTKPHPNNAQKSLQDVQSRDFGADSAQGGRMKQEAQEGSSAAYIDEKTGKPNKFTEYAKFLEYCSNRQDPLGGVGMAIEQQDEKYIEDEVDPEGRRTSNGKSLLREAEEESAKPESYYALGWGGAVDQDWYTGKKCAEDNEMMKYFRGYTMACSVLAGMSGSRQCWHDDTIPNSHDDFYTSNNIIFKASS